MMISKSSPKDAFSVVFIPSDDVDIPTGEEIVLFELAPVYRVYSHAKDVPPNARSFRQYESCIGFSARLKTEDGKSVALVVKKGKCKLERLMAVVEGTAVYPHISEILMWMR